MHQLAVHTVGGVITAQGDPIMLIVPENEALSIETKVQPQDIDQLHLGQSAVVRFSAFNQRTTPNSTEHSAGSLQSVERGSEDRHPILYDPNCHPG